MTRASARPAGRIRALGVLGTTLLLGAYMVLVAMPATAAVTCDQVGAAVTLTMNADGDSATVAVDGVDIEVDGTKCDGTAQTDNTDTIDVVGAAGAQDLTIDLSGGDFPGTEDESPNTNEIEFDVDLSDGNDSLTVTGGAVADTITFGAGGVALNDDNDADVTVSNVEAFTANGAGDADIISGDGGFGTGAAFGTALTINGAAGDDDLTGGSAADTIDGGADADTVDGGDGDDTIDGGDGDDSPTLNGGAGDDTIDGGAGGDTLNGDDGNDTLDGGPGVDVVNGDAGNDTVAGGTEADTVTGGGGRDTVNGGTGDDGLSGDAGSDTLNGNDGNDVIDGGTGNDTVSYAGDTAVSVDLGGGFASTATDDDDLVDIENASGTGQDDVLLGSGGNNSLSGLGGNDRVRAGEGDDTLTGGGGADSLRAGSGDDDLFGNRGADRLLGGPGDDLCRGGPGPDNVRGCEL